MPTRGESFLNAAGSNHAVFDACLVNAYHPYLNWTTARAPEGLPVAVVDLRSHVRGLVVRGLKDNDEFRAQDFSKRRPLVDDFVHHVVQTSGIEIHGQRISPEVAMKDVAAHLRQTAQKGSIPITSDMNPLARHPMNRFEQAEVEIGGERLIKHVPFHPMKDPDKKVLAFLTQGGSAEAQERHFLEFLRATVPFLIEVDDAEIEYRLQSVRMQLREMIGSQIILSNDLRKRMIDALLDDWSEQNRDGAMDVPLYVAIEDEVAAETRERDENTVVGKVLNESPEVILDLCFTQLLSAPEITPDVREKLIRRRPVMENMFMEAAKADDVPLMQAIGKVYEQYFQKLDLPFGHLGHLSLAIASFDARYDGNMYRQVLL